MRDVSHARGQSSNGRAEQDWSRRDFFGASLRVAGVSVAATLGYGMVLEPSRIVIRRHTVPIRGLPAALDGLQCAQITDLHHGPWNSLEHIQTTIDLVNSLKPDVVLLTGDYIARSLRYVRPVMQAFAELRPTMGTFAVLGNHDFYEDVRCVREEARSCNIPLIDNSRLFITPGGKVAEDAKEGLCIAGIGDLWRDRQDYSAALGGVPDEMPRMLLSHNPDSAEERALVRGGFRVDLMLCGHTHGGQIYIPGVGTPIIPSSFGQKYARGLVQGPVCPVFICCGVGISGLPMRIGVPPEIAVLTLRSA